MTTTIKNILDDVLESLKEMHIHEEDHKGKGNMGIVRARGVKTKLF